MRRLLSRLFALMGFFASTSFTTVGAFRQATLGIRGVTFRSNHHHQHQQQQGTAAARSLPFLVQPAARHTSWRCFSSLPLKQSSQQDDEYFDGKTTFSLVGGQSLLIVIAVGLANLLLTPNSGFGPGISFATPALVDGLIKTLPLVALAFLLDKLEPRIPALQDVTKATQRSVLALLGGTFKPFLSLLVAVSLGLAAGFGEEMLFRGVMQYEIAARCGSSVLSLGITSIIFGALHAVTPAYFCLATAASVYFGYLYQSIGNLAVPITTHAVYDIGALLYAHWTVTRLSSEEQRLIVEWDPAAKVTGPQKGNNDNV